MLSKKQISTIEEVLAEIRQWCEKPVFQVIDGDKHYKIWFNGCVEGFDAGAKIVNFYPVYLDHAILKTAHLIGKEALELEKRQLNDRIQEIDRQLLFIKHPFQKGDIVRHKWSHYRYVVDEIIGTQVYVSKLKLDGTPSKQSLSPTVLENLLTEKEYQRQRA